MRSPLAIAFLVALAAGDGLGQRVSATHWRSADGRTFEGVFLGIDDGTGKARFLGPAATRLEADPARFIADDRQRLGVLTASGQATRSAAASKPFRSPPMLDRSRIPLLHQNEFGKLTQDCVPNALASFLLWWDQSGLLKIPRTGDPRTKATWLHDTLATACATSDSSGTFVRNAHLGLLAYFRDHHPGVATVRVGTDLDCSAANLARYTTGPVACLLHTTVFYGDEKRGGHTVALIRAKPDGVLRFRTWGLDFEARLREPAPGGPQPRPERLLEITNGARLPEWFHQLRIRFVIDPAEHNGITVAVPYLYQKLPGSADPPPDPLFATLTEVATRPSFRPETPSPRAFPRRPGS